MTDLIIQTSADQIIKCSAEPSWNDFWQHYSVDGFRWIKSKRRWSANELRHSFASFEPTEDPA